MSKEPEISVKAGTQAEVYAQRIAKQRAEEIARAQRVLAQAQAKMTYTAARYMPSTYAYKDAERSVRLAEENLRRVGGT